MMVQLGVAIHGHALYLPPFASFKIQEKRTAQLYKNTRARSLSITRRSSVRLYATALNARCAAVQTEKKSMKSPSTFKDAPTKGKAPRLDDGSTGFPPHGGCGGGGGGGWGNPSGGFYLFSFLTFLDYLKSLEGEDELDRNRL